VGKLVHGVGINDADYVVTVHEQYRHVDGKLKLKQVWMCPFYQTWKGMLERGYSVNYKLKFPTYKDVTVCEEWLLFSTFKSWMEKQEWEGLQLDKDLLVKGNKVYRPEACVFVSGQVNSFMLDCGASKGNYKIGVSWNKQNGKFMARCNNPFNSEQEYLGYFTDEEDAHQAWFDKKIEHAYTLAALQVDERVAKALIDYYKFYGTTPENFP